MAEWTARRWGLVSGSRFLDVCLWGAYLVPDTRAGVLSASRTLWGKQFPSAMMFLPCHGLKVMEPSNHWQNKSRPPNCFPQISVTVTRTGLTSPGRRLLRHLKATTAGNIESLRKSNLWLQTPEVTASLGSKARWSQSSQAVPVSGRLGGGVLPEGGLSQSIAIWIPRCLLLPHSFASNIMEFSKVLLSSSQETVQERIWEPSALLTIILFYQDYPSIILSIIQFPRIAYKNIYIWI